MTVWGGTPSASKGTIDPKLKHYWRFQARQPLDGAGPEFFRVLGKTFLNGIRKERSNQCPGTGDDPEEEPDHRSPDDRPETRPQSSNVGNRFRRRVLNTSRS